MKKIFLSLLLGISLAGSAQSTSNKVSFQNGQKLEVSTNMNITSTSMLGESTGNVITVEEYAVANTSATETTLQKAVKKMKLNFSFMGKDYVVDSDNKADMQGQFGEPIKQILDQKHEFTIDATGKITSVKSDSKKKNEEGGNMLSMMMPGMNASSVAPKAGNPSIFKLLPEGREVLKGDTWADSVNTADNQSKTVYTVKDITESEVILDYAEEGRVKSTQSTMGMNIDVQSTSKTTGTITIDKASGQLKQRTAVTTTDSNMNLAGREMSTTAKTTSVTTVKAI
jgi:hypothetical protein